MDLKLIISDAIEFFKSHLVQIAALCLPWLLAESVVEYLIASTGDPSQGIGAPVLLAWTFRLLIYPIYTAALILLMAKRAQQQTPANAELVASAIKIWQPFFIVHLIGEGLTSLGVMLFILPGVYLAARLSFAEFYIVLERIRPLDAIQKSFHATKPHLLQILLLLMLFAAPLILFRVFLGFYLGGMEAGPLPNIGFAAGTAFLMLFVDVVLFRFFMSATQGENV